MVKTQKHQQNANIADVHYSGKWKVGRCIKCRKYGIRSNKWSQHVHEDWATEDGKRKNKECIAELLLKAKKKIEQLGSKYLDQFFPEGIDLLNEDAYILRIELALEKEMMTDPRNHTHRIMTPLREMWEESSNNSRPA